jgi:hypothetical protein
VFFLAARFVNDRRKQLAIEGLDCGRFCVHE